MKNVSHWSQILSLIFYILSNFNYTKSEPLIEIVTPYMTSVESDPSEIDWESTKNCPPGAVVTNYKFSYLTLPPNTPQGIQGVALQCSQLGSLFNSLVPVQVIFDGTVNVKAPWLLKANTDHAIGFTFHKWSQSNSLTGHVGHWKFKFYGEKKRAPILNPFPSNAVNRQRELSQCPDGFAICGFRAQRNEQLDVITKLKLICCYHCIPEEAYIVIYDFTNNGLADVLHTVQKRVGVKSGQNEHTGKTKTVGGTANTGAEGEFGGGAMTSGSRSKRQNFNDIIRQGAPAPPSGGAPSGGDENPSPPRPGGGSGGGGGGDTSPPAGGSSGGGDSGGAGATPAGSGSANFNLRARFTASLGGTANKGFNWDDTNWSLWDDNTDEADTLMCRAMHRCVLKQLVGRCGKFEFNTPSFDFTSIPIRYDLGLEDTSPSSPSMQESPMDQEMSLMHPGENWIVAENVTFSKRAGLWEPPLLCPLGAVVTGQLFKSQPNLGLTFTGIKLQCSRLNETGEFEPVAVLESGRGLEKKWYKAGREAIGCSFIEYSQGGLNWKQNFEIRFKNEKNHLRIPPQAEQVMRTEVMCQGSRAICGMQIMYDEERRGQITDLAFKCCRHCVPQEKMVVLESFTNMGFTDTMQNVRMSIGLSTLGNFSDLMTSNLISSKMDFEGIEANFMGRFPHPQNLTFDWSQTSRALWSKREDKMLSVLCRARHLCQVSQLVGVCAEVEIPTPFSVKQSFPLDSNLDSNKTDGVTSGQLAEQEQELASPGTNSETWIIAENVTFAKRSGEWVGQSKICPPGSLVSQVQMRQTQGGIFGGFNFKCSMMNEKNPPDFIPIANLTSVQGREGNLTTWFNSNSPAVGLTFIQYYLNGRPWKGKWEMRFQGDENYLKIPKKFQNVTRSEVTCPSNMAVCGVHFMFDKEGQGQTSDIALKCCGYCLPYEKLNVLSAFTNNGDTKTSQMVRQVIGVNMGSSEIENLTVSPEGLESIFSFRFKRSKYSQYFNWTENSFWVKGQRSKMMELECPPNNFCSYKQLVGICGHVEIKSPYFIHQNINLRSRGPLDLVTSLHPKNLNPQPKSQTFILPVTAESMKIVEKIDVKPEVTSMSSLSIMETTKQEKISEPEVTSMSPERATKRQKRKGIWITAQNLSAHGTGNGFWTTPKLCPIGSIVTAEQFKISGSLISGLNLKCSSVNDLEQFTPVKILTTGTGNETTEWYDAHAPAFGFTIVDFELNKTVMKGHWAIQHEGREVYLEIPNGAEKVTRSEVKCPKNHHAICGMQTMFNSDSEEILTDINFMCCEWCVPQEKMIILDSFTNHGSTDMTQEIEWVIGSNVANGYHKESGVNAEEQEEEEFTMSPLWLQKSFAARFSNSFKNGGKSFNWRETSISLFSKQIKKTTKYNCEGRQICIFKQLIGYCGDHIEILTPFTVKQTFNLDVI